MHCQTLHVVRCREPGAHLEELCFDTSLRENVRGMTDSKRDRMCITGSEVKQPHKGDVGGKEGAEDA